MIWFKLLIMLMPIPAVYLIYSRFFAFKPEFRKHAEALIGGILLAFFIYIASPLISILIPSNAPFIAGFIKAALVEKGGALILLIIILRYYPNRSIVETALASAIFGVGFSIVENAAYMSNFGNSVIIVRSLFSLPIHMTSCGILGYYLGKRSLASTSALRKINLIKGLTIAVLIHGIYDTLLLSGAPLSYAAAPLLVISVAIMEFVFARAQSIPSQGILAAMGIHLENWISIDEQLRYERWIMQSMGRATAHAGRLFIWEPGITRLLIVILFMGFAIWGLSFREEISAMLNLSLTASDEIMVLGVFPISVSVILMIVGAVNPDFFSKNEMKIPVIIEATPVTDDDSVDTFVTYSLSHASCFLKTHEPIGIGKEIVFNFNYGRQSSGDVRTRVVWENHHNRQYPFGTILHIDSYARLFSRYIIRYRLYKMWKGFVFNFQLPGFETTRRLFMHPLTAMQEDRIFVSGDPVFREGDDAKKFYLLKKGRVTIRKRKGEGEILIGAIDQGQLFGEMALIPGRKRGSSAICESDSIIAISDRSNLNEMIRYNPDFALSMIQMLAERTEASEAILLQYIALLEREEARKKL
jgi:RsiW-degrading membrane proteinase PrsW (M82 family)